MQNKFINLVNEALSVNSELLSKSVKRGFETSQNFAQHVSEQAVDWSNVRNFDEYAAKQKSWNEFVVGQAQKSAQSAIDFGSEVCNAYLGIWTKAFASAPATEAKVVKAKAA